MAPDVVVDPTALFAVNISFLSCCIAHASLSAAVLAQKRAIQGGRTESKVSIRDVPNWQGADIGETTVSDWPQGSCAKPDNSKLLR